MCGITGIFNFADKRVSRKVLLNMTNSIAHRGPDDSGIVILNHIGLGNRRLAIIDLSKKGHQPMPDSEKKIWVTFNGEIYNFKEIKLQQSQFRKNCLMFIDSALFFTLQDSLPG